jgi:ubiquitin fusion degradation protein 1
MFSSSFLVVSPRTFGRPELNAGGKVLLPQLALGRILKGRFQRSVMLFSLENPRTQQKIAAGVESFTCDSASCIIPEWMSQSISLVEHEKVIVTLAKFPSATSVIFQPFNEDFNRLPNPRVILEHTFRQIPCLTQGTVIPIEFNDTVHFLKVLRTEPERLVSIVHADVSTDFARPISDFDHRWGEEEEVDDPDARTKTPYRGRARKIHD